MSNFKVSFRTILISSLITIILLMLPIGLVIAEKNTRQIGFEDNPSILIFQNNPKEKYIGLNLMGKTYKLDFTSYHEIINDMSNYVYNFIK